jgi:hypothetical protein
LTYDLFDVLALFISEQLLDVESTRAPGNGDNLPTPLRLHTQNSTISGLMLHDRLIMQFLLTTAEMRGSRHALSRWLQLLSSVARLLQLLLLLLLLQQLSLPSKVSRAQRAQRFRF